MWERIDVRFREKLAGAAWLLLCDGRVSYRRLAVEFKLDETELEVIRQELVESKGVAVDEDGEFLIWAGAAARERTAVRVEPSTTSVALPPIRKCTSAASEDITAAPSKATAAAGSAGDAERRPLTVMFCDLADSTALSTRLDPEDLQDVIRAYQETCAEHIREYEGFVAKYMGDGILVYFGYPTSLERNAERAVRSALDIVAALAALNNTLGREKGIEIAVRVGIATGIVMVGEVVGEGMAQERTVIGEAPNMAARLQGLADRNGIVIGGLTKDLCGDVFGCKDLGANPLKGIEGLVQSWGVTGLRDDTAREARREQGSDGAPLTLVGRDEEIGLLHRAWQSTREEALGHVVTLTGEAGIGKSALIGQLKAQVRTEGLPQLTMRCSPYHTNSALFPVIEHFKRLARWQPEDAAAARLAKLETMLGHYNQPLVEAVPLMAALLSLTVPEDRYDPLGLTPQQQKQQTQDMIIGITMEVAEKRPFLELWEDLHWADPSTLELIGLLIEQAPTASLLIVMTARPEFVPPWHARSHMTPITLNRLERPHAEALVGRITGEKPLPGEVVDHIATKTDGVPLYVEELTKTILASDILRDTGESYELTGPLASLSIPDTLQDSLMARLDRLPQVRELAQLGSVLGREFAYEMISGLATSGDSDLQAGLGQLVDAELLYQRGRPPRAKYIFKHALVQDAAYASLLRRTREQYHHQAAELLESRFPEVADMHPEVIAHHFSEANVADRAIAYFRKAGDRASGMSANAETVAHLSKALTILKAQPESTERSRNELALLTSMGPALFATRGSAPELEAHYRRAMDLGQELGDVQQLFSALHGLWFYHYFRADLLNARSTARQLVEMAAHQRDAGLVLASHRSLGYSLHFFGELEAARSELELVISSYDPEIHAGFASRHSGADPGAGSTSQIAWTLFALGYPDQAAEKSEQGLELARRLAHPYSESWAHVGSAALHQFRGDLQETLVHATAGLEIAEEKVMTVYVHWATVLRGWASFTLDRNADAIVPMREAMAALEAMGADLLASYFGTLLTGGALGQNGQVQEALDLVTKTLAKIDRTEERFWEPELHRLKGQLLLDGDPAKNGEAEACFSQAIEVARSQQAKSWELRAATSLARLWKEQNREDEVRNLLRPVYDWFTEGFGTADLKDAKTLLGDLA